MYPRALALFIILVVGADGWSGSSFRNVKKLERTKKIEAVTPIELAARNTAATVLSVWLAGGVALSSSPAEAIQNVPMELTDADAAAPYALNVNRRTSRRLASQVEKKKSNEKAMEKVYQLGLKDVAGSLFFGGALYFATGSRNCWLRPLLGDFLYEEEVREGMGWWMGRGKGREVKGLSDRVSGEKSELTTFGR